MMVIQQYPKNINNSPTRKIRSEVYCSKYHKQFTIRKIRFEVYCSKY